MTRFMITVFTCFSFHFSLFADEATPTVNPQSFTEGRAPLGLMGEKGGEEVLGNPKKRKSFDAKAKPTEPKTVDPNEKYKAVSAIFDQAGRDRKMLEEIRSKNTEKFFQIDKTPHGDYIELSKDIAVDLHNWLNDLIKEVIIRMGPPPTKFSMIYMGSLARNEGNLYSDLEGAFLVEQKTPEVILYFEAFFQRLSTRIYLLGEHEKTGLTEFHLDGADHAPYRSTFNTRYASYAWRKTMQDQAKKDYKTYSIPTEGSRLFLATPKEFASHSILKFSQRSLSKEEKVAREKMMLSRTKAYYQEALAHKEDHWLFRDFSKDDIWEKIRYGVEYIYAPYNKKEKDISIAIGKTLCRNVSFAYGDRDLYASYLRELQIVMNSKVKEKKQTVKKRREEIGYLWLEETHKKFGKKVDYLTTGHMGDSLDPKRDFYRLVEQIFTNLNLYYDLKKMGTADVLDEMVARKMIEPEFGKQVRDLINFALKIRIKNQIVVKKSSHDIFFSQSAWETELQKTQDSIDKLSEEREILIQKNPQDPKIEMSDAKIFAKKQALWELEKAPPGSVLTEADVQKLNNTYIPIMQELYRRLGEWLASTHYPINRL